MFSTILLFLAVLFVLVLVHEFGHFITAKISGMRVDEFGIGFPPKLFGKRFGETEYTLNALPIGGFVRIHGEDPTSVDAHDSDRSFGAKPRWVQAIVLLAGVTMNVLLAWILFAAVFMIGVPEQVSEERASENARMVVVEVLPGSPADGVLMPGDEIVAVSGYQNEGVFLPSEFTSVVESSEGDELMVTVPPKDAAVNDVSPKMLTLTPAQGVVMAEPDRYAIGVSLALVETVKEPFFGAFLKAGIFTLAGLHDIALGLGGLLKDAVFGEADFTQVAGPVGLVGLVGDAASFGFASLMLFTAVISLNLAIINLLPVPALDGGRLLFVAIEAVRQKAINPVWTYRLNAIGMGLLLFLMVLVTYSDVAKLL